MQRTNVHTQFGFRNFIVTREAIFSLQVLFQGANVINQNIYGCIIIYQKTFDRTKHDKRIGNTNHSEFIKAI